VKNGRSTMGDRLARQVSFTDFPVENWMLLAFAAAVVGIAFICVSREYGRWLLLPGDSRQADPFRAIYGPSEIIRLR
jgi:hypothetical protein